MPIAGSSSGTFLNPAGDPGMVVAGVGTSSFSWGTPSGTPNPNNLTFTGLPFATTTETVFTVGRLDYYNGSVALGSSAEQVDLKITMAFTTPAGIIEDFQYTLQLINTPNTGDPVGDADYVKLPTTFVPKVFSHDGVDYTLQLLGFGNPSGGGFVFIDEFFVFEDARATADLLARVTSDIPPVPEPATMALTGLGLAAAGALRRRRGRA